MSFPYPDEYTSDEETPPPPSVAYRQLNITGLSSSEPLELQDDVIEDTQTDAAKAALANKENVVGITKKKNKNAPAIAIDLCANKRWPHFKNLIRDHPSLVKVLLAAVDDSDAQHEVGAKNTVNLKDNKWAQLRDVTFGGERGSLVGLLPGVPKATELKKKVLEIWKHCECNQTDSRIDKDVMAIALRQYKEYLATEKAEIEGKEQNKRKLEQLQLNMSTYERGKGAMPEGAKETAAGRVNHSVNLGLGQPSSFGYAHYDGTTTNATNNTVTGTPRTPVRPPTKKTKESSSSGKSSASDGVVNNHDDSSKNKKSISTQVEKKSVFVTRKGRAKKHEGIQVSIRAMN